MNVAEQHLGFELGVRLWPWVADVDGERVTFGAPEDRRPMAAQRALARRRMAPHVNPCWNSVSLVHETDAGQLIGTDAGEWGGALVWFPHGGEPRHLMEGDLFNFHALIEIDGRLLVLAEDRRESLVLEVTLAGTNAHVETVATLPMRPYFDVAADAWSVWEHGGDLWVGTYDGLLRVGLDGTVETVGCVDTPERRAREAARVGYDPNATTTVLQRMQHYWPEIAACRDLHDDSRWIEQVFVLDANGGVERVITRHPGPAGECIARAATNHWNFGGVALDRAEFVWWHYRPIE